MPHDSRYPLKVETAVQRAVTLLLPGVSTASEFIRYYALYAALAAFAEDRGLEGEACRELVRRSEVVLAGTSMLDEEELDSSVRRAHGVDGVRPWFGDVLDVRGAVNIGAEKHSYSSRKSGFWGSYGGPSQILGTVAVEGSAFGAATPVPPGSARCSGRCSPRPFMTTCRGATGGVTAPASIAMTCLSFRGCWICSPLPATAFTTRSSGSRITAGGARPCGYLAARRRSSARMPA